MQNSDITATSSFFKTRQAQFQVDKKANRLVKTGGKQQRRESCKLSASLKSLKSF